MSQCFQTVWHGGDVITAWMLGRPQGTERAKFPALLKPRVQVSSPESLKGFPGGLAMPSV